MKLLIYFQLLQCETGSLRKYKSSVPCFVSLSNNYVIVKACSRNILAALIYHTIKRQPAGSCQISLAKPPFVSWERKVDKMHFAASIPHQFLLYRVKLYHHNILSILYVCLAKVCECSVLPNVMKDPLLRARVFLCGGGQ